MILDHPKVLTRNHSSNVLSGSGLNAYLNKIFCCWPSMILEEGLSHNISRRRIIKLHRLRLSFPPFLPALTTPPTAIKRTNNCWDVVIKVGQVGDIEYSWYRIPWPLLNSKTKKNSNDVSFLGTANLQSHILLKWQKSKRAGWRPKFANDPFRYEVF